MVFKSLFTKGVALAQSGKCRNYSAKASSSAKKAAQEFEAVFISQMLKPMFESIEIEPPFGGGSGEEVWKGLQVEEYGKAIARAGGIGLADQIFAEILKMQEVR